MKSATRHMLLLAGMLCLWASAYTLGRSDAQARAPSHRAESTPPMPAQAALSATTADMLETRIAVGGLGMDIARRAETAAAKAKGAARARGADARIPVPDPARAVLRRPAAG